MTDLNETIAKLRELLGEHPTGWWDNRLAQAAVNALPALLDAAERGAELERELVEACAATGSAHRLTDIATGLVRVANATAEAAEQRLVELEQAQRWIPVGEDLPEVATVVETWDGIFRGMSFCNQPGSGRPPIWSCAKRGDLLHNITHWRELGPLPDPPQTEETKP